MSWRAKRSKSSWAAAPSWLCNRARNSAKEFDMVLVYRVPASRAAGAAPRIFADSRSGTDLFSGDLALPREKRNSRLSRGGRTYLGAPAATPWHLALYDALFGRQGSSESVLRPLPGPRTPSVLVLSLISSIGEVTCFFRHGAAS